jgi:hypothetical protein
MRWLAQSNRIGFVVIAVMSGVFGGMKVSTKALLVIALPFIKASVTFVKKQLV